MMKEVVSVTAGSGGAKVGPREGGKFNPQPFRPHDISPSRLKLAALRVLQVAGLGLN